MGFMVLGEGGTESCEFGGDTELGSQVGVLTGSLESGADGDSFSLDKLDEQRSDGNGATWW